MILFSSEKKNQNKYDLIILSHSLEHFKNPKLTLKAVHKLLKKNGFCYILIPNFKSYFSNITKKYWGWLQPSVHYYHFSPSAFVRLSEDCKFKLIYNSNQGGDSLFLLLTIFNLIKKFINFHINFHKKSNLKKIILKFFSIIFKYIYYFGNDESLFLLKKR